MTLDRGPYSYPVTHPRPPPSPTYQGETELGIVYYITVIWVYNGLSLFPLFCAAETDVKPHSIVAT